MYFCLSKKLLFTTGLLYNGAILWLNHATLLSKHLQWSVAFWSIAPSSGQVTETNQFMSECNQKKISPCCCQSRGVQSSLEITPHRNLSILLNYSVSSSSRKSIQMFYWVKVVMTCKNTVSQEKSFTFKNCIQ